MGQMVMCDSRDHSHYSLRRQKKLISLENRSGGAQEEMQNFTFPAGEIPCDSKGRSCSVEPERKFSFNSSLLGQILKVMPVPCRYIST